MGNCGQCLKVLLFIYYLQDFGVWVRIVYGMFEDRLNWFQKDIGFVVSWYDDWISLGYFNWILDHSCFRFLRLFLQILLIVFLVLVFYFGYVILHF